MNSLTSRLLVIILILIAVLSFPGQIRAANPEQLEKYLTVEAAILGASDNVSLDFQNIDGSSEVTMKPTRSWIPASTIKAYVLVEVFNQVRQGLISFDQKVVIRSQNVVATPLETDEFPRLTEGTQATIRQLAEAMIIQSDNTAYNTLLDTLDRRNINNTLASLGLTETIVGEKLNLDDDQYQIDSQLPGHQFNTTTVKDYASFFSLLANDKIPGSSEMITIFKRQKFNDMIPALLPKSVSVAHKTGFWAPIYHDGGVVYKPNEPFVLAIFSNANDPTVNARLAKVAYFQNSDSVGLSLERGSDQTNNQSSNYAYPVITLAQAPSSQDLKVLGTQTNSKFPEVTAADLGITTADLTTSLDDSQSIKPATIFPGSWAYLLKRAVEATQLALARNNQEKASLLINISRARLSEIRALKQSNRPDLVGLLIKDEQSSLSQVVNIAKNNSGSELQLVQVKQLSDNSFAMAGDSLTQATGKDKERLIDNLFTSFQESQKNVAPVVAKSLPTSPFNQPLVGTVQAVNDNKITVAFTDGSTKTVLITPQTPSRAFGQKGLDQETLQASVGAKIAVVGEITKTGEIIPNFILRNVPKEIPEKKEGLVIKIDSQNHSLDVKQSSGQTTTVIVDPDTIIKGRDTDVSLNGIKAGSTVTIFGDRETAKTTPISPPTVIKATTITVTKNASGRNEKVEKPKKSSNPPKPEPSKQVEQKGKKQSDIFEPQIA